jgi:excisionase family DNA binding protein
MSHLTEPPTYTARPTPRRSDRPLDPPPLLTLAETCAMLRLQRASVYRLIGQGRLRAYKLGRATRVTRTSIDALLADLDAGERLVIRQRTPAERRAQACQQK